MGVSGPDGQAGPEQAPTKISEGTPKEGSNRGYETGEHARANIEDSISGRSQTSHPDHTDDGRLDKTKGDDEEASDSAQPT